MLAGPRRVAWIDGFDGQDPGKGFGGHLSVAMHENDERISVFVLHHERLDDQVLVHPQIPG